jgi:hypothetical protein
VLEICRECIERGVHLHIAKTGIIFDDTMQSKIVTTVLGLVAEIERDFIRQSPTFPKGAGLSFVPWQTWQRRQGQGLTMFSWETLKNLFKYQLEGVLSSA